MWFVVCVSAPAGADPFKLKFTATISEIYNDNVFFDADNPVDDFITLVSPKFRAGWQTEVTDLMFGGSADIYDYQEYKDRDAVDQVWEGQWERKWGPRFSTTLFADYLDDERREREVEETGLLFNDDRRRRQLYGLSGQYRLSELTSAGLTYKYSIEDFDNPREYDLDIHTVQMLLSRRLAPLSERGIGRLQLVGGKYDYRRDYGTDPYLGIHPANKQDRQSIDYYSATLGLIYNWTEKLDLTIDLGTRYTSNAVTSNLIVELPSGPSVNSSENDDTSNGYVVAVDLTYAGEKGALKFYASHDLVPASGREGTAERTTLRLGGRGRLTEQLRYSWWARGYLNRSDGSEVTSDDDELTISLQTRVRYLFNHQWNIGAYWYYTSVEDRNTDIERHQNTVTLRLQWNWAAFE